jgi:hypothetical protein
VIERIVSPDRDLAFRDVDAHRCALGVTGKGEVVLTKRQLEWIVVEGMRRLATLTSPPRKVEE